MLICLTLIVSVFGDSNQCVVSGACPGIQSGSRNRNSIKFETLYYLTQFKGHFESKCLTYFVNIF